MDQGTNTGGDDLMVDCHAHIFQSSMPLRDKPRHAPTYDYTLADYAKALDAHGVHLAVLAAASPWADYNDFLVDSINGNPRFRGTVILEPTVERYVLDFMARAGVVGVRMHMIGLDRMPDITTFEYRRMFRRIRDQGWHIHLHCAGPDLPDILPVFERAGVDLVVDHLGRPDPGLGVNCAGFKALLRTLENGRTWVKASGHGRIGPAATDYLKALVRHSGDTRLVWGSDCPFVGEEEMTYQSTLDWLHDAVPDPQSRRRILGLNAIDLYFKGQTAPAL
ncbi:amidohydrolase family protein [Psychromarinibacter sp. C21-152]|uniref:Amidohydrolase family protein n=1 Tax=Psychromarinibacter sediminicola TaxID=3033385 RepID=A0AAE3NRI0_9RHOB|nr:amidohydrolase family protein [Psychromarinibacter sediminicola]MDF0601144.1 amidohydrolase family protein [Psychromarinibacter sediminicola]